MTHIRMIFKHLCLNGMLQWHNTILLPLLCSTSLFSPNFDVKSIIFPNFGQGPFPKIAGKSPVMGDDVGLRKVRNQILINKLH